MRHSYGNLVEVRNLGDGRHLVKDNGNGVSEDILVNAGKGLSIVMKLVNSYGGELKAYSDNGACFEFTLMDVIPTET